MAIEALAPAKINLTLHVTGQRADGYHLLDSLVIFADAADRVAAHPAPSLGLQLCGPQAGQVPAGDDNLVLRAARLLAPGRGARLVLDKRLPVAGGIGGGSSDAAAALRVLAALWGVGLPGPAAVAALGADVPVCLDARPRRMAGIGERLAEVPPLPPLALVLVNPGCALSTPEVFAALHGRGARGDAGPFLPGRPMPDDVPRWADAAALAAFLALQRNDLQAAAIGLQPVIGTVLAALAQQPGCRLARMSGSGATCFGIFARGEEAAVAAAAMRQAQPGWWVQAAAPLPPGGADAQLMRATT